MKSVVDCPYWHLARLTVIPLLKLLELCCTGGRHAVQSDEALSAEGEAYSQRNVTASVTLLFLTSTSSPYGNRKSGSMRGMASFDVTKSQKNHSGAIPGAMSTGQDV